MRPLTPLTTVAAMLPQCEQQQPPVCTRGPETQLKLETGDETTCWKNVSATGCNLELTKPGVFRYEQQLRATQDSVVVQGRLHNDSSWDWRDAYVYYCCGVDPCPELADCEGERTLIVTGRGLESVSGLRRCVWTFGPGARKLPRR